MQALETFHAFFHTPAMLNLQRRLLGAEPFVYPMKMARVSTPRKIGFETPPHQDARSHRAGLTMAGLWVALHDVPAELGRLKLLAGSHTRGVRPVFEAGGAGGIQCEIYPDETEWHVCDYRRGDLVLFHSRTVHRAEPNLALDAVRIPVDTRFCDCGAPVFRTNIEPHHGWRIPGLDWDIIYHDWQNTGHPYYWIDYPGITLSDGRHRAHQHRHRSAIPWHSGRTGACRPCWAPTACSREAGRRDGRANCRYFLQSTIDQAACHAEAFRRALFLLIYPGMAWQLHFAMCKQNAVRLAVPFNQ